MRRAVRSAIFLWLLGLGASAAGQNAEILRQQLDTQRHGYTVMRVWGSHEEMGFAIGATLAGDILQGLGEVRDMVGTSWTLVRTAIGATAWPPAGIEQEFSGMVAGVHSVEPGATLDALDLKVLNTFSDWGYACRSHSCWGEFVTPPVRTLSTRRLDFGTPFPMALHHVLCAFEPSDGSPAGGSARWVNLAWPGYLTVVSGVNEAGTLVSLHDYNSQADPTAGLVPRSVATRLVLSDVGERPPGEHLGWAAGELAALGVVTGTFLNYYAPEGAGGVFTCPPGDACGAPRTPQADYFGGQVLITTNSQTDGLSTPSGGSFMADYYTAGGPKDIAGHFELMGTGGLHLLTVAYRGRGDMTLWFMGRADSGTTDRVEVEWSELFPGGEPDGGSDDAGPDAGQPDAGHDAGADAGGTDAGLDAGADAGGTDAGEPDAGGDAGEDADRPEDGGGCGCGREGPGRAGAGLWLLLLLALTRRTRRTIP